MNLAECVNRFKSQTSKHISASCHGNTVTLKASSEKELKTLIKSFEMNVARHIKIEDEDRSTKEKPVFLPTSIRWSTQKNEDGTFSISGSLAIECYTDWFTDKNENRIYAKDKECRAFPLKISAENYDPSRRNR